MLVFFCTVPRVPRPPAAPPGAINIQPLRGFPANCLQFESKRCASGHVHASAQCTFCPPQTLLWYRMKRAEPAELGAINIQPLRGFPANCLQFESKRCASAHVRASAQCTFCPPQTLLWYRVHRAQPAEPGEHGRQQIHQQTHTAPERGPILLAPGEAGAAPGTRGTWPPPKHTVPERGQYTPYLRSHPVPRAPAASLGAVVVGLLGLRLPLHRPI